MVYTLLELVKKVDVVPYPHQTAEYNEFESTVYTFKSHDGSFNLGYILPFIVTKLSNHPEVVIVDDFSKTVELNPKFTTLETRSKAMNDLGEFWKSANAFDTLKGWRNELYTIYDTNREPYMRLERALCPLLGVVMYGCHINGYCIDEQGGLNIWVPRRSPTKPTYPGMLDNTVAGGLGYPYGCFETCVKECYEEAGLEEEFVKTNLKSVGVISYLYQYEPGVYNSEKGLVQPEVEYIYDLKMGVDIIPHPVDNEAEDFRLMPVQEVLTRMKAGEFKHNCAGIIIDFLIRFGLITPENEPDFVEINTRLHRLIPFPLR